MMTGAHKPAFARLSDFNLAAEPIADRETQVKNAYDDGYHQGMVDGRAEANADAEQRVAEAAAMFDSKRSEDREDWKRECADLLVAGVSDGITSIKTHMEEHIGTLLRPWLIERVRLNALTDLETAIGRVLSNGTVVHVEAPSEIVDHLRERLTADSVRIEFIESASANISVRVDDTEIAANISAWIADLEAAT